MQHRFTDQERDAIRNKFANEPLLQIADVTCQFFDNQLQSFVLWPEDVFYESLSIIDEIKEHGDEYIPKISNLWKTIFPRFREYDTTVPAEQPALATSIVLDIAAITLRLSADSVHQYMGQLLMNVISNNNKTQWETVVTDLGRECNYLSSPLRAWIQDYMQLSNKQYLSDDIAELLAPAPKTKKSKVVEPFKPDYMTFTKRKAQEHHIIALYQELLRAGWIADGDPDDFFALFSGDISECKIVWTGRVGKGNLYALFKMMVDEEFITVPEGHGIQPIVETHFVDTAGKNIVGIDSGKPSKNADSTIKALRELLITKVSKARLDEYAFGADFGMN